MILLGIIVVATFYGIGLYNHLVNVKHAVAKAWANIDVLLKQRHDELPKLVEVCKQCKQFEQETFQKVITARSQVHAAREYHRQNIQLRRKTFAGIFQREKKGHGYQAILQLAKHVSFAAP